MKFSFAFILFFVVSQVSAQSKFGVGIVSSADITGMIGNDNYVGFGQAGFDKVGLGYQNGVRFRYQLNPKVSLQVGLSMVSHQLRTPRIYLNPRVYNDPLLPNSFIRRPSLKVIQVPFLVSYYIGNKLKFGATLGLAYNYVYSINENTIAMYGNEEKEFNYKRKQTSQNQFVSALLGVGVEYSVKKFTFRAEPTASYQLFYLNNGFTNNNYNLYSVGFNISGFYFF